MCYVTNIDFFLDFCLFLLAEVVFMLRSLLKGVGPKTATAMVDIYGAGVVDVLNSADAVKKLQKARETPMSHD